MANLNHGVFSKERATSLQTPVTASAGITFAVGVAPAHARHGNIHTTGNNNVNKLIYAGKYSDAIDDLGYSDDWERYSLCEVMDTHFKLYGVAPVIFVNVLDPTVHRETVQGDMYETVKNKILLPFEAISDSIVVQTGENGTELIIHEDYKLYYGSDNLTVELISEGTVTGTSLYIEYDRIAPELVTADDIIGGYNAETGKKTGLELVDAVFTKFGIVPEFLISPGYSHLSKVAAVLDTKAGKINGLFKGKALIDVDTNVVKKYSDVNEWKTNNNIFGTNQILLYPNLTLGGKVYNYSSHFAALMAGVDSGNDDIPSRSPDNQPLKADGLALLSGEEIELELSDANLLNSWGVCTALNFMGGFKAWGNWTACYPSNTDPKDYFIAVNRMFGYVSQTSTLTYWNQLGNKITRRLADSIVNTLNIWLNGLTTAGHLLGGRVEFPSDENSELDVAAGKLKFNVFVTPPSPLVELSFVLEYDANYIKEALG